MRAKRLPSRHLSTFADDPIFLLRSEHAALLGQLELLERYLLRKAQGADLLRTLIRDSAVHFRREEILLRALGPKLGAGPPSIEDLALEHRDLRRQAVTLWRHGHRAKGGSSSRRHADLRSRLRLFTKEFREHIQHEETVLYVLARTRLRMRQLRRIACEVLAV